jgi:hypothetical protein
VSQRSGRNPQVVVADDGAAGRQARPDVGVDSSDRLRDRNRIERCENRFDDRSPARSLCATSAVHTVEQLADGEDTDRPFLVCEVVDGCVSAFERDEQTRVDAPLRTISISSPARTRFSASEKFRETCVAVIRVIG